MLDEREREGESLLIFCFQFSSLSPAFLYNHSDALIAPLRHDRLLSISGDPRAYRWISHPQAHPKWSAEV